MENLNFSADEIIDCTGNMNFVVSLACIKMKMNPEEAINAATINSAFAMNLEDKLGSITKGKLAIFFISITIF
jgi:imidazolonepropionase